MTERNCVKPHPPKRKPKRVRSGGVKEVREATGLLQKEFGRDLGVSRATVDNWERGNGPTDADILRIAAYAGVLPWTLDKKKRPRDFANLIYNSESWREWRKSSFTRDQIEDLRMLALETLSFALSATVADENGDPTQHIFRSFLIQFDAFIRQQVGERALNGRMQQVIRAATTSKKFEGDATVGDVRQLLGHLQAWKDQDDPAWSAELPLKWQVQAFQLFAPFIGFAQAAGKGLFVSGQRAHDITFKFHIAGKPYAVSSTQIDLQGWLAQIGAAIPDETEVTFAPVMPFAPSAKQSTSRSRAKRVPQVPCK